jgi:hypothetical protein
MAITTVIPAQLVYDGPIALRSNPATFDSDAEEQLTFIATNQAAANAQAAAANDVGGEMNDVATTVNDDKLIVAADKITVSGYKDAAAASAAQAASDANSANGNPLGAYANGITFNSHNDYVSESGLFRLKESVNTPYTTSTATYPTAADDINLAPWSNVSKRQAIALSLNVPKESVLYSTDTTTPLDNIQFIYAADQQLTYSVPSTVGAGETIVSVVNDVLNTSGGSYETLTPQKTALRVMGDLLGWIDSYGDGIDYTTEVAEWASSEAPTKTASGLVICGAFQFNSNSVVTLTAETEFLDAGNLTSNEITLDLSFTENVIIHANGALINHNANYTEGEQRHCVRVGDSAKGIVINNLRTTDAGGDGFYVGTPAEFTSAPVDIELNNCSSLYSRRQGLSITNVDGITVSGGKYSFTGKGAAGGTFPMSGIDIEPNSTSALLRGIKIYSPDLRGNAQKGFEVALYKSSSLSEPLDILLDSPTLSGSGFGLRIHHCPDSVKGKIVIKGPVLDAPAWTFLEFLDWSATGVDVEIDSPICNNVNPDNSTSNLYAASSLIKIWNTTDETTVGGLTVHNIHCKDSVYIQQIFKFIKDGTAGFSSVALSNQDMLKLDDHIKIVDLAPHVALSTEFTKYRRRFTSINQDSNAGFELGSIISNYGYVGESTVRLSTALVDSIKGNIIRFENATGGTLTIFTDATGALILPSAYQDTSTRTIKLHNTGDSVDLFCDEYNRYWLVKNPVIT